MIHLYWRDSLFTRMAWGSMAADIFSEASERFGIIVMASNNSSNQSYAGSRRAAASMFKDARLRYNVDSTNLFVAGFSGGSRVASNLAIEHPFVKGVIGCGAGMYHNKNTHPEFRNSFFYYGIIGRRDMNLIDMMDTEERLSQMHVGNHVQYLDITHVWPPAGEITAAIAWLRYRIDTTDYDARDYFLFFQTREVQSMKEEGLYLDAVRRIQSVDEVFHDSGLHEQMNLLMNDKIFRKQVRKRKRALEQELKLKLKYLKALSDFVYATELRPDTVYTPEWWEGEIKILKKWKNSGNVEASRLADRLLYLLEVHFDEDIRSYQNNGQCDKALYIANLWMMIPPD